MGPLIAILICVGALSGPRAPRRHMAIDDGRAITTPAVTSALVSPIGAPGGEFGGIGTALPLLLILALGGIAYVLLGQRT